MSSAAADPPVQSPRRGRRASRRGAREPDREPPQSRHAPAGRPAEHRPHEDGGGGGNDPPPPNNNVAAAVPHVPTCHLYPPHLLALGAASFLAYIALYIVDWVIIYLTYLPPTGVHALNIYARYRLAKFLDPSAMEGGGLWLWYLGWLPTAWHTLVDTTYMNDRSLRYIDTLLMWSFALDIVASSSAALLLFYMWWYRRPRPPGASFRSVLAWMGFPTLGDAFWAVLVWFLCSVWFVWLPDPELPRAVYLALTIFIQLPGPIHLMIRATGPGSYIATWLHPMSQVQLANSASRLARWDAYRHQPTLATAIVQGFYFLHMFTYARQLSEYWYTMVIEAHVEVAVRTRLAGVGGVVPGVGGQGA